MKEAYKIINHAIIHKIILKSLILKSFIETSLVFRLQLNIKKKNFQIYFCIFYLSNIW